MSSKTVRDYMSTKIHSIRAGETAHVADSLMEKHGVRHLPVLDGGKLVGVISDRDIKSAVAGGGDPRKLIIENICAPLPYVATASTPLAAVAKEMAAQHIGSTVIVDDDEKAVGIFTASDALRALSELA